MCDAVPMARSSAGRSVLSRHLQLLDAFDVDAPFLTVSDLARRSRLSLATVHRLAADLQENGIIERLPDRTYRLGVRLWELACRTPGALGIREIAGPHLHDVHEHVRQHAQLGVIDGEDVVFLERLSMRDAVVNVTLVGGRLPLHASSSGIVLLAHAEIALQDSVLASPLPCYTGATITDATALAALLRQVRASGHVVGDGFIHPDARGIAVPVHGAAGGVIASISIVVPNDSASPVPYVQLLRAASARITADLRLPHGPGGQSASDSRYRRALGAATRGQ